EPASGRPSDGRPVRSRAEAASRAFDPRDCGEEVKPVIYVDADACPVKDEALRVAARHDLSLVFVSNAWMRLPEGPNVERVIVPEGPDAADDWIAERI